MTTKVRRWGHSLGLRIPRSFAREAGVDDGSEVALSVERGRLVIRPVRPARYTLEMLLEGITRSNLHAEADTGKPVGRERI